MNALRNIVVGVDLTPASRGAFAQASRIAARNYAALHAIHAIEPSIIDEVLAFVGLGRTQPWDSIRSRVRKLAQRQAEEAQDTTGEGPGGLALGALVDVEIGAPVDVLTRAARTHAADILVLGVRGGDRDRPGPGPVATACLRHAPTQVLLAREEHTGPYTSIVACTDFSELSLRAIQMAARIARFDNARLQVLHIAMPPGAEMEYSGDPLGLWPAQPVELMEVWNGYRASLRPRLAKFVEPLAADLADLAVKLEVAEYRHCGRGIAAYAREHDADLLVLGTQGRTNLRYALLGSTAERVLAECACSALVVRAVDDRPVSAPAGGEHRVREHLPGRWEM
jgi:universal stress protein E